MLFQQNSNQPSNEYRHPFASAVVSVLFCCSSHQSCQVKKLPGNQKAGFSTTIGENSQGFNPCLFPRNQLTPCVQNMKKSGMGCSPTPTRKGASLKACGCCLFRNLRPRKGVLRALGSSLQRPLSLDEAAAFPLLDE